MTSLDFHGHGSKAKVIDKFGIHGHARIQRGGAGGPDPLKLVRGGVLCVCLMGRRGIPKVVSILFFFWLTSLASIIHI